MLVGTFILGMLFYNMFKGMCGCKLVEGLNHGGEMHLAPPEELSICNTECESELVPGACVRRCMVDRGWG